MPVYATLLLGADTIARYGDDGQRQRYLPDVIDGHRLLTAGLAEPGRSDPTRPATTARRDGDGWRLDGTKELVPAAQLAHTMLIPAALDDGDVGVFLVDADADGVEIRPVVTTNGEPHADVFLDGAAVSERDRLPATARDPRVALRPRACRAVRDPARRHRARAAHGRVVHHRTRAVRQADRKLPGRAAADGRRVHRRRGDPVDHVAGRVAARPGRRARPGGGHREVLGGRSGRASRGDRPAGSRRHRHRHHLSAVPLLPVGQTQRADPRFGVRAIGAPRRRRTDGGDP